MTMLLFLCMFMVSITSVTPVENEFRINKCCKDDEWLDTTQRQCRKLPGNVENENISSQEVAGWPRGALVRGGGLPPECSGRRSLLLLPSRHSLRYEWQEDGSLLLHSPTARGGTSATRLPPEELCAERPRGGDDAYALLLCPCDRVACVSKCCPRGALKRCSRFKCACVDSAAAAAWTPFHAGNALPPGARDVPYEVLEANEPSCPSGQALWVDNPAFKPSHYTSYWWRYPDGYLFSSEAAVCGDLVVFDGESSQQTIGYCYAAFLFEGMFAAGAYFRVLPTALLAVTMAVLVLAPERRLSVRGWVHSKALLCHAASLLLSNALVVAYVVFDDDVAYCRTVPFIMYFSLVAAAFWLNAICINMAWGFGRPRGPHAEAGRARAQVFMLCSLYAWGAPALMTAVAAVAWYLPRLPSGWLRPTLMETRSCFWEDEKGAGKLGTLAYFYGPVGSLLLVNASLFLFISVRVKQLKRKTSILTRDASTPAQAHRYRQALLYVRIVWLMGVAEMAAETAAWAAHGQGYLFLLAAELVDFLRVLSIFVLCVCKRRTLHALRTRLCAAREGRRQHAPHRDLELPSSGSHDAAKRRSAESTATVATICDAAVHAHTSGGT